MPRHALNVHHFFIELTVSFFETVDSIMSLLFSDAWLSSHPRRVVAFVHKKRNRGFIMLYHLAKNTFITGILSVLLLGCNSRQYSPSHDNENSSEIKSQMDSFASKTQNLIGSAHCTTDQQCHSIGFGEKPCGGFYEYKIYSDLNTDVPQLKTTVSEYNSLSGKWNRQSGAISDCMMLIQPELSCKNHSCQIK